MIKLVAFDTFGTLTDWHTGVSEGLREIFPELDASRLAIDWRREYHPALAEVESGARPWTLLDDLHRESLQRLLAERYATPPAPSELDRAVHLWHVLPAWPDVVAGLTRIKPLAPITPLSNGSVALLSSLARHNGMPWDFLGGADVWRHYKPSPETYLGLARLFDAKPHEVLMVAAHASDLSAARSLGLRTAFITRPAEWGPLETTETGSDENAFNAADIEDLATQLGC